MTIGERLMNPARRLTLDELVESWFSQRVEVRMPGYGALAGRPDVLRKIRGSWGRALMSGASRQALAGQPCPFSPPCALDVFFREQARNGRYGIPKPWVIAADKKGHDLVVRLTIFGFATEWSGVASHCLCDALKNRVNWHEYSSVFLPKAEISAAYILTSEKVPLAKAPGQAELVLLTPADIDNIAALDQPSKIIASLARHISGLARWQDSEIDTDWKELAACWHGLDYDISPLKLMQNQRRSGRQMNKISKNCITGSLHLFGNLAPVWPLLVLGQSTHLGRAAAFGFGRYRLQLRFGEG